jgi:hypothetical protein
MRCLDHHVDAYDDGRIDLVIAGGALSAMTRAVVRASYPRRL